MDGSSILLNKSLLAYCGIYCEQCSFKLAHDENDIKHLQDIPYTATIKELSAYNCEGCKGYCICGICKIKPCASKKEIDSCADCDSFPCNNIDEFERDGMPHHKAAIANLRHIKQYGIDNWFNHLKSLLRCKQCGEKQSWYYSCVKHSDSM